MKLTLKELNEIVTDAQMEAEEMMRNRIVKYINEGYTTTGIMYMLGKFNLVTGEAHDVKLDYDMSLPIIVKRGVQMWIATNEGWLSIVKHRDKENTLLVRARNKNHIESIFEDAKVYEDANADYPYRADINDDEVSCIIGDLLMNINYDNFKASVDDSHYHHALVEVWDEMYRYGKEYRPK